MAANFPSGGNYLSQANQPPLGSNALSVTAWVNVAAQNANNFNVFWWRDSTLINEFIVFVDLGRIKYEDDNSGGAANTYSANSTYAFNTWGYLAWTRSSTTNLIYWNNALVVTANAVSNISSPISNWIIGGDGGRDTNLDYLNGSVAALNVWSATLTPEEIADQQWHYRARRRSNIFFESPLLKHTDVDYSGNGNNFSVTGTPLTVDGPPISFN